MASLDLLECFGRVEIEWTLSFPFYHQYINTLCAPGLAKCVWFGYEGSRPRMGRVRRQSLNVNRWATVERMDEEFVCFLLVGRREGGEDDADLTAMPDVLVQSCLGNGETTARNR